MCSWGTRWGVRGSLHGSPAGGSSLTPVLGTEGAKGATFERHMCISSNDNAEHRGRSRRSLEQSCHWQTTPELWARFAETKRPRPRPKVVVAPQRFKHVSTAGISAPCY